MAENENVQNPEAAAPQAQPEQDDQPVFQCSALLEGRFS